MFMPMAYADNTVHLIPDIVSGDVVTPQPINPQPINRDSDLDTIVTYGTRTLKAQSDLPYTLHVLNTVDLDRLAAKTVPESLGILPGIHVQKTASGHGSPYIRGFTGNRTLTIIDGIRYNNATYRDGPNEYFSHIDVFLLDQIEVLSGPASTLYGSEAVGGTISLTTRKSDFMDKTTPFIDGEHILRSSSGDQSFVSRTSVDFGHGNHWGARFGVSIKNYGDVRAAKLGRLLHTAYSERAYDGRIDLNLGAYWTAILAYQRLTQDDVPRTHSTIFSRSFAGTEIGTDLVRTKDQDRRLSFLKLQASPPASYIKSAELTLSKQARMEEETRIKQNGLKIEQGFSSDLWALNSVFESDVGDISLTYGLDLTYETIESERTDYDPATHTRRQRIQGPVGDDATYEQIGMFMNSNWGVSNSVELEMGGRYSAIHADIGRFEDPETHKPIAYSKTWSNFSTSARLTYKVNEISTLWAGISQSFRAPNIADISRFGRSRSNEFEVASFSLKPETFLTAEAGYRLHTERFNLSTSYYYTDLNTYIDTLPTGRIIDGLYEVSKRNSASGHIQGIDASVDINLNHGFSINAHATWLDGRITRPARAALGGTVTEPMSRIQPLTGYFALNWESETFWVTTALKLTDKADKLSEGDMLDTQRIPVGGTPGYTLLTLKSAWNINENIQITFSLNNILNMAYRSHGSGNNAAGRHISTGLRLRF